MKKAKPAQDCYLHAPGDLSRADWQARADSLEDVKIPDGCELYFLFTCPHCGTRNRFCKPWTLYESGDCRKCRRECAVEFSGTGFAKDDTKPKRSRKPKAKP